MASNDVSELFSVCDRDAKGFLTLDEFAVLCAELALEPEQTVKLFGLLDVNRDGKLEKKEFLERFARVTRTSLAVNPSTEVARVMDCNEEDQVMDCIRTSTPTPNEPPIQISTQISNGPFQTTWDKLVDKFGHVIFALKSYEKLHVMFKLVEHDPVLVNCFRTLLASFVEDVSGLSDSIVGLENSLTRLTKQGENQLSLLEEEMDAQIRTREKNVRQEENERTTAVLEKHREKYEKQIAQLQEAVDNFKKVEDRLSGISPYGKEMENLRTKLREMTSDNAALRTLLNEAETNTTILRGEISSLKADLHGKMLDYERESDAVTLALSEHESMSQQVNSLFSENRRLQDSNDNLRVALDSNVAKFRRNSSRMSMTQAGEPGMMPHAYGKRTRISRSVSPAASYHDYQALAACDPGRKMTSYSGDDDDTEFDISFKSSLDDTLMLHSAFEADSGIGTFLGDNEFDRDLQSGLETPKGSTYAYTPYPPTQGRGENVRRRESTKNRLSQDGVKYTKVLTSESARCLEGGTKTKKQKTSPDASLAVSPTYKVILCGDANVGKSSFILRLCQDEFHPRTRSTLGLDFRNKNIRLTPDDIITVQLWDTAGQERFRSISTSYFRKVDGVILMYDVTCPASFVNVRDWMERVMDSVSDGTPVLICGNKVDLRIDDREVVLTNEGAQLAANYGVLFMETSASSGMNIDDGTLLLARHLVKKHARAENITDLNRENKKTSCC